MRWQEGQWVLWAKRPEGWIDLHGFFDTPRYPIDNVCTNHFLCTHPRSPFRKALRATRIAVDHALTFEKGMLTVATADEVLSREEFAPRETPQVLEERFGVVLSAEDRTLLVERILAAG
jgi:N-hydroxyarylamine O-acetyltransferase